MIPNLTKVVLPSRMARRAACGYRDCRRAVPSRAIISTMTGREMANFSTWVMAAMVAAERAYCVLEWEMKFVMKGILSATVQ